MEKIDMNTNNNYLDTSNIMKNISETWHLEAKQEHDDLFFYIDDVNSLKSGEKAYVIGRKGMGKTAISEYLYNQHSPKVFSERLSFKNFPFNLLYSVFCKYFLQKVADKNTQSCICILHNVADGFQRSISAGVPS